MVQRGSLLSPSLASHRRHYVYVESKLNGLSRGSILTTGTLAGRVSAVCGTKAEADRARYLRKCDRGSLIIVAKLMLSGCRIMLP